MQEISEEFADKGLVVLAISNEDPKKVGEFVDSNGAGKMRVAAASPTGQAYGVKGIPAMFAVGPDGKVIWRGHPGDLSDGKIKELLKGAKPAAGGFLGVRASDEMPKRLDAASSSAATGKLAKALTAAKAVLDDPAAAEADKTAAQSLTADVEKHVKVLLAQAESFIEQREVMTALTVLDAVAGELDAHESGKKAKARADEVRKDKALVKELDAAKAFETVKKNAARLASSKARDQYKDFAEKWSGTRAAEKAKAMSKRKD